MQGSAGESGLGVLAMIYTQQMAFTVVKGLGFKVFKNNYGEYVLRNNFNKYTYYTDDLEDLILTARHWHKQDTENLARTLGI